MITEGIYAFLEELAQNNNKPWFDANRAQYEKARADFLDFISVTLQEFSTRMDVTVVEPKQCVFRINRDVRFSPNKAPYKINFSCSIGPNGKKSSIPNFIYIQIEPGKSFMGMGLYELQPDALKAVRQEIDYNFDKWQAILNAPDFKKFFGEVLGERLKTTPKGYDADHQAIYWLRLKQFYIWNRLEDSSTKAKDFPAYIGKVFDAAKDFNLFLADAIA